MKLTELLTVKSIKIGLSAKNKKEVISRMVDLATDSIKTGLSAKNKITNLDAIKTQVLERENLATTGIGNGIALPHAKSNSVRSLVASFAILKTPIDFEAIDGKSVRIVFLFLSNEENIGKQLRCISTFSKVFSNEENIEKILNFEKESEIFDFLAKIIDN